MSTDRLIGPKLKIERAKSHIDDLQSELTAYFGTGPYAVRRDLDANGKEEHLIIHSTKPIPNKVFGIVGDAIHNLRASLDYLAVALARANGATKIGDVYFPFGRDRKAFEASAKEKIKRLSPDAREMIYALQPYGGGNDFLFALHALDLSDKHQTIVPVAGYLAGGHGFLSISHPAKMSRSVFGNLEKGIHWMTVPKGADVKYDLQVRTDIAFIEIQAIEGHPVTTTVEQFRDLVEGLLLTFEKRFFT